jgi:hypothetical protein
MSDERELGRLEGEMADVKGQIAELKSDFEELQKEVHGMSLQVTEMRAELRTFMKQRSPLETLYAYAVFAGSAGALYLERIEPWMAGVGVVVGALVLQRANLSKVVTGWFNRGDSNGGSRASGAHSGG